MLLTSSENNICNSRLFLPSCIELSSGFHYNTKLRGLSLELTPGHDLISELMIPLSVDHRVSDGAEAAQFMQALAGFLENPVRMLV